MILILKCDDDAVVDRLLAQIGSDCSGPVGTSPARGALTNLLTFLRREPKGVAIVAAIAHVFAIANTTLTTTTATRETTPKQ